jgi:acetoin utilization deacetylase AcuC-like enzyme
VDIALADGCGDACYLDALACALPVAIERSQAQAVIYLAGADPYAGDRLGRLSLSLAGLRQRDRMVLDLCARHDLPVAVSMGGGYAQQIEDIVEIHFATVCTAAEHAQRRSTGV